LKSFCICSILAKFYTFSNNSSKLVAYDITVQTGRRDFKFEIFDLLSVLPLLQILCVRGQFYQYVYAKLFTRKDPKSAKSHHCFLGSACIKAANNGINILRAAFARTDSKIPKKTDSLTVFFALLGSLQVKAAHKHVGEIDSQVGLLVTTLASVCCSAWFKNAPQYPSFPGTIENTPPPGICKRS